MGVVLRARVEMQVDLTSRGGKLGWIAVCRWELGKDYTAMIEIDDLVKSISSRPGEISHDGVPEDFTLLPGERDYTFEQANWLEGAWLESLLGKEDQSMMWRAMLASLEPLEEVPVRVVFWKS